MATTPTTTPATATALARPPRGTRGQLTVSQQRLAEPLILEQAVLDPTWNTFKTVMVFLGGIAILAWLTFGGYSCGRSSVSYQAPAAAPAPAATSGSTVPAAQPQWSSYADCQRAYVLILRRDPEGACDNLPH